LLYRFALPALLVLGPMGWSSALAQPLAFGAINGSDDFSHRTDLAPRTRFGGLRVSSQSMALNGSGKVRSLGIVLDGSDFDAAYRLLVGRYGPASDARDFPRWTGFDDGALLSIRKAGANAVISFDYPENAATTESALNPAVIASLLLFAALGLGAGVLLYRGFRAKPMPTPQPSMRATLERRLREGRDLQF
jgi:hypothetical protein